MRPRRAATKGDERDALQQQVVKVWHDLDALVTLAEQAVRKHQDEVSAATSTPVPGPQPTPVVR